MPKAKNKTTTKKGGNNDPTDASRRVSRSPPTEFISRKRGPLANKEEEEEEEEEGNDNCLDLANESDDTSLSDSSTRKPAADIKEKRNMKTSTTSDGDSDSHSKGEEDIRKATAADIRKYTSYLKNLKLVNGKTEESYAELKDKQTTYSELQLEKGMLVGMDDICNDAYYDERLTALVKKGVRVSVEELSGPNDNRICKVVRKLSTDGDVELECIESQQRFQCNIYDKLMAIADCVACGEADECGENCISCPTYICNDCIENISTGMNEFILTHALGYSPLQRRCEECIIKYGLLPKASRDAANRHIQTLIDEANDELEEREQMNIDEANDELEDREQMNIDEANDELEEREQRGEQRGNQVLELMQLDESDTESATAGDCVGGQLRTVPNVDDLKKALRNRKLGTKHNLKAADIRKLLKGLFPSGQMDEYDVTDFITDEHLWEECKEAFNNLGDQAGTGNWLTTALAAIAPNAIPVLQALHTQHCQECNGSCPKCIAIPDGELTALAPRITKIVRNLLNLFDHVWSISKAELLEEKAKIDKAAERGARLLKGKHIQNFGYNSNLTYHSPCPYCGHGYMQRVYSDEELANIVEERKSTHSERVDEFEEVPNAIKNNATRPRLHKVNQLYKCPCEELSGTYCPSCEGEDEECVICACQCNIGPIRLRDFQPTSIAAQAEKRGISEDASHETEAGNEKVFRELLTSALENSATDLLRADEDVNAQSLAGSSAKYVAESEIDDNTKQYLATQIGKPSDKLDGKDVSTYQQNSVGHRFYGNNLGARTGRTGGKLVRNSSQKQNAAAVPVLPPPPPAAAATAHQPYSQAIGEREVKFEKRSVQRIMQQSAPMSRKKRVIEDIGRSEKDGGRNATQVVMHSFVANETASPAKGKSQEAACAMLDFAASPEANSD